MKDFSELLIQDFGEKVQIHNTGFVTPNYSPVLLPIWLWHTLSSISKLMGLVRARLYMVIGLDDF